MDGDAGEQLQGVDFSALLPDYRRLTRLYCMNGGHHLQLLPDGTVQGQRDDRDVHSKSTTLAKGLLLTHLQRGLIDQMNGFLCFPLNLYRANP